jgi:hypothetical protein
MAKKPEEYCIHRNTVGVCSHPVVENEIAPTFVGEASTLDITEESIQLAKAYRKLGLHIILGKNHVNVGDTEAFCTGVKGCKGRSTTLR